VTPDVPDYERHAADLQVLACRRSTLEWVLRSCALAERGVEFVTGHAVTGLAMRDGAVHGVRLDDSGLEGDVVVAASGPLALWACEDDSTPAAGGTPTATGPTSTLPTPTGTTGTPDGGGEEAGPSGTGELLDVDTLKLTNASSVPAINGCIRPKAGSAEFTGPVFRAEGIPPNSVSARVATNVLGPVQLKVIANGESCSALNPRTGVFRPSWHDRQSASDGTTCRSVAAPPGTTSPRGTPSTGASIASLSSANQR
jgi:hypothetical protein